MSESFIKVFSAIILAFVVFINSIGNIVGIGDIIPTQPAEEPTTVIDTTLPDVTTPDSLSKAELVALLNSETAKIAEDGSYSIKRTCAYTSPIDVGGATGVLNGIIGAIDKNASLDTVVGDFLGIGVFRAETSEDVSYYYSEYILKATALTESDITSFSASNGVYTFTLPAASNPKRDGGTAFARFTNDFVTEEEVADGIADVTSVITVNDSNVEYKNIKVTVTVAEGKITNLKYSYEFDATMALKAVVTINGTGAAAAECEYSNIVY